MSSETSSSFKPVSAGASTPAATAKPAGEASPAKPLTPFKRPLGAAGRAIPLAPLADGRGSAELVPDSAEDSGYFRALEQRGLFLNRAQIEAVRHGDGPLLTLAGAGSGKTSVLVSRAGYLIRVRGADPRSILLVTFSVKAAAEMKARISYLPGITAGQAAGVTARTFHSFFLQLLRSRGFRHEVIGGGAKPQAVMTAMLREMGLKDEFQPETALAVLSDAKLNGNGAAGLPEGTVSERSLKALLLRYEDWKETSGSMDFDDILLWSHRLLLEQPELLRSLQRRFRYVMIDEFQDTNRLQYELIRLLVSDHGNLMAVGDDDQTIYGFNGARSEYILGFRDAFPGAATVTLDVNYRSSASIVGLGNEVIRHNKRRHPKTLQAAAEGAAQPQYITPGSTDQEAEAVSAHIRARVESGARAYGDFAVLYRTASSARAMFEALVLSGIPFLYTETGELFYEQPAVKPLVDCLRLSLDRRNFDAMEGMLHTLYVNRHKGMAHIRALDAPRPKKGPLIHLVSLEGLKEFQQEKIRARIAFIKMLKRMKPAEAIKRMRRDFYDAFLETEGHLPETAQKETVKEALDELESSAGRFTEVSAFVAFVDGLIARHAEMKGADRHDDADAVKLMTIHKSKGLEFAAVVLIGASESILPHSLALDADKLPDYVPGASAADKIASALEEERRLAYVAVTRAKEELLISSPAYYRGRKTEVSRFIQAAFGLQYKGKA
ncbi:ATP-dependent helicase [Paenibacillus beijingensis]|uniref:ATP-dependent helicase n=1 Tax=Paenibacillus beijingensis TaxID=1126833 RepID=UPI0009E1CC04|nr:ATP-dependent helicase [Paenibacillus beijingensis]